MKDLSFTIRRATSDDSHGIAEVHVGSWKTTYPGIVDQAYIDGLSVDDRAAVWARRLETEDEALERGLHAAIVRVLADNPACAFYEKLGAELVRESQLEIAGKSYPERWYAWRNLHDLAA